MCTHRQLLLLLLLISALCLASDGIIRFSGRIVEPTCVVQMDYIANPTLKACSPRVSTLTVVTTQTVRPEPYMLVWRANETTKPDLPVTQWKVVQLDYK